MEMLTPLERPFVDDIADLCDHELIEAMAAARRLAAQVQAMELAAVAELARRRFAEDAEPGPRALRPAEYVHDEVAQALTLTATAADDLIRFATELTERLPATFAALSAGAIDFAKARTLWHGTDRLGRAATAAIETRVLSKAPAQTTGQIRAKIRRLVGKIDPDALARRRVTAQEQRALRLVETDDGTTDLTGTDLPTDAASAAYSRVTAIATALKNDGDARGIDQLRADVYLALLRGDLPTQSQCVPPQPAGVPITSAAERTRPRTSALSTAAGRPGWSAADDQVAEVIAMAARAELGTLAHHLHDQQLGAVTAQAGRRIGQALAPLKTRWCAPCHDRPSYRPTAAIRRLIETRDRRCCFPGCRRPIRYCDADHSIPFGKGGHTCPCNLAMLCRRHHVLKQTRQWRIEHLWPGVILWISPTGHWTITAPADRE